MYRILFVVVALLMIIIGYFRPVPHPAGGTETSTYIGSTGYYLYDTTSGDLEVNEYAINGSGYAAHFPSSTYTDATSTVFIPDVIAQVDTPPKGFIEYHVIGMKYIDHFTGGKDYKGDPVKQQRMKTVPNEPPPSETSDAALAPAL